MMDLPMANDLLVENAQKQLAKTWGRDSTLIVVGVELDGPEKRKNMSKYIIYLILDGFVIVLYCSVM